MTLTVHWGPVEYEYLSRLCGGLDGVWTFANCEWGVSSLQGMDKIQEASQRSAGECWH